MIAKSNYVSYLLYSNCTLLWTIIREWQQSNDRTVLIEYVKIEQTSAGGIMVLGRPEMNIASLKLDNFVGFEQDDLSYSDYYDSMFFVSHEQKRIYFVYYIFLSRVPTVISQNNFIIYFYGLIEQISKSIKSKPGYENYNFTAVGDSNMSTAYRNQYNIVYDNRTKAYRFVSCYPFLKRIFNSTEVKIIAQVKNGYQILLDLVMVNKEDNVSVALHAFQRIPITADPKFDHTAIDIIEPKNKGLLVSCQTCLRYFPSDYHKDRHTCEQITCEHCINSNDYPLYFNWHDYYCHLMVKLQCPELCKIYFETWAALVEHITENHLNRACVTVSSITLNMMLIYTYQKLALPYMLKSFYIGDSFEPLRYFF